MDTVCNQVDLLFELATPTDLVLSHNMKMIAKNDSGVHNGSSHGKSPSACVHCFDMAGKGHAAAFAGRSCVQASAVTGNQ